MDEISAGVMGAAPTLCYGCHDRIDEKRYVHGPLAVGDCLVCHDPHRGYGAAHLREEQAPLCGKCHTARENTATVVCNAAARRASTVTIRISRTHGTCRGPTIHNALAGR